MTSTFIASSAVSGAVRSSLMKLQMKLAEAQKEVATGRLVDVGLSQLQAGQTVSLRQEHNNLQSITDSTGSSPRAWMQAA
jgi:flagellar hook-associated protein 3 FlgL